jgi:hypothetical protein
LTLPPYIDRGEVHRRLQIIFPDGTPHRNYCVRETAAATVFVMLYIGAVEGTGQWLAPKHVIRMTAEQAVRNGDSARTGYAQGAMKRKFEADGTRWYAENSREGVRDETIRQGLMTNSAASERPGIATTANLPRYALRSEFAALFDPKLDTGAFESTVRNWQAAHLSAAALARTALMRRGAVTTGDGILVTFPNKETRRMKAGPSSVITKAVVEIFAVRFLQNPAVLWLSESGTKVVARDDELAAALKLKISADRHLPDVILVDLGAEGANDFLLVFVEVVATDGAITAQRREVFQKIATEAGFSPAKVAFVTAYLDRSHAAFRTTVAELAWDSFAWFAAEPENLLVLRDGASKSARLSHLAAGDQ